MVDFTPRTILLTGSTGFLGSNLLRALVNSDYLVIILKRSGSDTSRIDQIKDRVLSFDCDLITLESIFAAHSIDIIIHCATNYGRGEKEPCVLLEANLFLPLTLLELGRRNGVRCFINTDTILDKRVSWYSLSKCQFKEWLKLYATSMTCINVALEHFYGPCDDRTKFVTFIIRNLMENVERIPLTPGVQKRDFIYIDDVVEAFSRIIGQSLSLGCGYFSYEIGSGQAVRIKDFVAQVKSIVGESSTILEFGALPYREHEVMESHVDTRAIRELGWEPAISLEEGLRRTIAAERELK